MPVQDQAVWRSVTVVTGGTPKVFNRGELLPPPATDGESGQRTLLRLGGALRVVEVVFTEAELAARGRRQGQGPAESNAGAGVASVVAPGPDQDPRVGAPVVLGPKPPPHGTKREWVAYAETQGMGHEEAEGMTRDGLADKYRDGA
jgi:hypothetical protein